MTETTVSRSVETASILIVDGPRSISIRAGTAIHDSEGFHEFAEDTPVMLPELVVGEDYGVKLDAAGSPFAAMLGAENPIEAGWLAGFHFAPGGNAEARAGGDSSPAINPFSLWDVGFRPSCPNPRGMALIDAGAGGNPFWADIYLLSAEHDTSGTSRYGAMIADGQSVGKLDYHDAVSILAGHGKRLLDYAEFSIAAFGVTERTSSSRHPKTAGLDAARTSRFGLMQATGNLWQWGTDGDPDEPRPSLFGGYWSGGAADTGSRYAILGSWPEDSFEGLSARGACDHLATE